MDDGRSFGHDTLTLPALFIPDGNPDNLAAGIVSAIGPHAVVIPAIFIPDGYDGPRQGYPWIEFGRMTLPGRATTASGPRRAHINRGIAVRPKRCVQRTRRGQSGASSAGRGFPAGRHSLVGGGGQWRFRWRG